MSNNQVSANDALDIVHELGRIMRQIDVEMHRRARPLDTGRVGPVGSMLMMELSRMAPAPVQKVVETVGRDPSQITRVVKRLEGMSLIRREFSAEDGRVSLLDLTETGRAHVMNMQGVLSKIVTCMIREVPYDDRIRLLATLRKM